MDENDRLQLTALKSDMEHLIKSVDEIKEQIKTLGNSHITKATFDALRERVNLLEKIVFGGLGVVLITVLGAIIALVIRK